MMGYQNDYRGNSRGNAASYGGGQRGKYNQPRPAPKPISPMSLPGDYLDQAEKLMEENTSLITTSKIRRLFSLVTEIYNEETLRTQNELSPESVAAIAMTRVRFAYECGRDKKVKEFVEKANLMNYLKGLGSSREEFIKFAQYMEALVAYHKFFGGREN